jgi:hypothetical protein
VISLIEKAKEALKNAGLDNIKDENYLLNKLFTKQRTSIITISVIYHQST